MEAIEKNLANPISPELRQLLEKAVKERVAATEDRLRVVLPENSEPCTSYRAEPREVRNK